MMPMMYTTTDPNGNQCVSSVPYCGYTYETLKDMEANGYTLYADGKKIKFPTRTELKEK